MERQNLPNCYILRMLFTLKGGTLLKRHHTLYKLALNGEIAPHQYSDICLCYENIGVK